MQIIVSKSAFIRLYGGLVCLHLEYGMLAYPVFRRYGSFSQYFQEKVGQNLDRSLSPSPQLTQRSSPQPPPSI